MKKKYLLWNERFFTSSETEKMVSAVLVEDGVFSRVGTLEECRKYAKKTSIEKERIAGFLAFRSFFQL